MFRHFIYLFIYLLPVYLLILSTSGLFTYFPTSGLIIRSFYLLTYLFIYFRFTYFRLNIYSFIYLFILMAYGHLLIYFKGLRPNYGLRPHPPFFPPPRGNFVRTSMPKPRGRSTTVSLYTMQRRRLLNTTQFCRLNSGVRRSRFCVAAVATWRISMT